jgi:hypothetical protein
MVTVRALLVLVLTTLAACGDSTSPTESVAGSYHATSFVFTPPGSAPIDVLAAGGSADITLNADGTTTGTLVVPAEFSTTGQEFTVDLAGTFTRSGNTLSFQQEGDSFIRELVWTVGNNTLSTTDTSTFGTLQVTLTRS